MNLVVTRCLLFAWVGVLTLFSVIVTGHTSWFIYESIQFVKSRQKKSYPSTSVADSTTSSITRTLIVTLTSSVSFTLSQIAWLTAFGITLYRLYWKKQPREWSESTIEDNERVFSKLTPLWTLNPLLQLIAFSCLFNTYLSRLCLVYYGTPLMIQPSTLKLLQRMGIMSIMLLCLTVISYFAFNKHGNLIALLLFSPVMISYPIKICWLSYRFFANTRSLCNSIDIENQESMDLLEVALRLTIVTGVAVSSTLLSFLAWMIWLMNPESLMIRTIAGFVANPDSLINNVCLLCSLKQGRSIYEFLFGWFHRSLMQRFLFQKQNSK